MKKELKLPEEQELKAIPFPKAAEKKLEIFMSEMTKAVAKQYKNETYKKLNQGTIEKFEDAQVGNWAAIFTTLSNKAKRKIKKRFNKDRIFKKVKEVLESIIRINQYITYTDIEEEMGINSQQLLKEEGLKPTNNAFIQESFEWVMRNLDETLQDFSANSLRVMAGGDTVENAINQFDELADKRVEQAKFLARNQVANFNALSNKVRYQNLGITEAVWVTAQDERVRHSHADRDGKRFNISEGLYSSVDGKTLMVGLDYGCRCIMKPIIPEDD